MENKITKDSETEETESEFASNVHRELAVEAAQFFDKGEFVESLSRLVKLQEQRPLDTRFTHNAAVVEFYMNGNKNVDEFKKKLNAVCNQGEINLDNVESLDDVRNCCIYFNHAVLLYHSMQYSSALRVANKIFMFVESLDEELRRSVTLLLAELLLRIHQPDKALSVIICAENLMQPKSNLKSADENLESNGKTENIESSESIDTSDPDLEAYKLKLKIYRCRCYLNLRNSKACEKELPTFLQNSEKVIIKNEFLNGKLYETRCNNMKRCAKFLNAQLEYLKGSYKSCVQILSSILSNNNFVLTGDATSVAFYNNLGCIHLYMGKPHLAGLYFRRALQENKNNRKFVTDSDSTNLPLFISGGNKLPQLMYNLGVSLLLCSKPIEAFDCLTLAVQVYHMNPRLWLRLAECCIMVHKNGNDRDFDFINKRKEVLQEVIGTGIHRKLILNLNLFENNKYSYDAQSFAIPVASLEFATLCLRNALLLLSSSSVDCSPSNPVTPALVINLRASVLVASSYVSLCLGDPIIAMNNCRNLLSIPNCSGVHKLLGHLYIAEAFILLDRIPEALEHLKPDYSNYMLPSETTENYSALTTAWKPDNSANAKAVFQYNLAVVLALKGDLVKAAELLKQVWLTKGPQSEIPVQIISLALYIELSLGHADIARNIIKQNCPQYNHSSSS